MVEFDVLPLNTPCTRPSIEPYCERVRALVTAERFEHIVRVTVLTETIARANDFDEGEIRAARLAAVLHDAARDLAAEELFRLAPPENDVERQHPLSVHGRAARVLAERWGVTEERVLEAVAGHVFGVPLDNRVGMALYVADVSEPGRGVNEAIRNLACVNLARAYQMAVDTKVNYLRSQGKAVHPVTLRVYEQIRHAT